MISTFYLFSLAFMSNEIYHIFNRKWLDLLYKNKNPENMRRVDIVYYLLRVFCVFWTIAGIFSFCWGFFIGLALAALFKFAAYHADEDLYNLYSLYLYPFISLVLYLSIFMAWLIR